MYKTVSTFFIRYKERLGILGLGHLMNAGVMYGFDWGLYPFIIWMMGPLVGGIIMTLLSVIFDLIIIYWYDKSKQDWLGIEAIKGFKEGSGGTKKEKLLRWIMNRSDKLLVVLLSLKLNPFNVVLYMRHGANEYNGMSARDWKIFVVSTIVGNLYWTLVMFGGITAMEAIWVNLFGG